MRHPEVIHTKLRLWETQPFTNGEILTSKIDVLKKLSDQETEIEGKLVGVVLFPNVKPTTKKTKAIIDGWLAVTNTLVGFSLQVATATIPFAEKKQNFLAKFFHRGKYELVESKGLYRLIFYYESATDIQVVDCGSPEDFAKAMQELTMSHSVRELERVASQYKFNIDFLRRGFELMTRISTRPGFFELKMSESVRARFSKTFNRTLDNDQIKFKLDFPACALWMLSAEPEWAPIFRTWQIRQGNEGERRVKRAEKITAALVGSEFLATAIVLLVYRFYPQVGFANTLMLVLGLGSAVVITLAGFVYKSFQDGASDRAS